MTGDSLRRMIIIIERAYFPRCHAELRQSPSCLIVGLIGSGVGLLMLIASLYSGTFLSELGMPLFGLVLVVIGGWSASAYFQSRIFFRRFAAYEYSFGRFFKVHQYATFDKVELGPLGAPLQIAKTDGTVWKLPNPDDEYHEVRGEILWQISRAAIPVPDVVALRNRISIGKLATYSRSAFRDQPYSQYKKSTVGA
ncbi:MAG: hypothetical protein AAFY34_07095 [Pseudomonadota bacterium]